MMSLPLWGHLRGLVALACRSVQQRPDIGVTILTGGNIIRKAEAEVTRYFSSGDKFINNVRIIGVLEENPNAVEFLPKITGACLDFYEAIYRQDNVKCIVSGCTFQFWPKPKAVISDIYVESVKSIQAIDPAVINLAWTSMSNSASIRVFGPEELGGQGDICTKARIESENTGKSAKEIEARLCYPEEGKLLQIPGLPPMYDYEFYPQTRTPKLQEVLNHFRMICHDSIRDADGIITAGTSAFEADALNAWRKWEKGRGKELYVVGPLLPINNVPSERLANESEKAVSDKGSKIGEFLERTLLEHSEHSLIYVSSSL
ncbi:glycosyltransferase family 1 protein, partial [Sphaerobolus stellatus SS14]